MILFSIITTDNLSMSKTPMENTILCGDKRSSRMAWNGWLTFGWASSGLFGSAEGTGAPVVVVEPLFGTNEIARRLGSDFFFRPLVIFLVADCRLLRPLGPGWSFFVLAFVFLGSLPATEHTDLSGGKGRTYRLSVF